MNTQTWDYTKIVATIGPASDSNENLDQLIQAGMNVARFNTKHSTPDWHALRIDRVREVAKNLGKDTAVLIDLQGPEIRITLPTNTPIVLKEGETVTFASDENSQGFVLIPKHVIETLNVGNAISIDDGNCEFTVTQKEHDTLTATALSDCQIGQRKTLNTPGITIDLPSLIEADYHILDMMKEHPADFVALSFVRNAKDIAFLRSELEKRSLTGVAIVAKIENQSAIDHLEEIIEASDAVMVARGDLAVEIPIEQLAARQKEIIILARAYGKPVITATQMLKSMVENSRPTRAEVSDVANAIFDGTDAIMLSEETTIGKHPIATVKMMRKIARYNEALIHVHSPKHTQASRTTAVTQMVARLVEDAIVSIDKIVVLTETGFTIQQLSRHRILVPILAVTPRLSTAHQSSLSFGVKPIHLTFPADNDDFSHNILVHLLKQNDIKPGERILLVHGSMSSKPGFTNTISLIDTSELPQ